VSLFVSLNEPWLPFFPEEEVKDRELRLPTWLTKRKRREIMKNRNKSILGWVTFFCMTVAMVLVLSGSMVLAQKLIDLNTASDKELESIKGVGPATAKKIIAGRPYKSVDELPKAGLTAKQVEAIKPLVTVGSAAPAPAAPTKEAPAKATATVAPAKPAAPAEPSKAATSAGKATTAAKEPPVKGMVWVNTATKVYHVEGDRYYGNTKKGEWMTEEEAIKKGYHKSKQETKTKK
jgi:hypothetical protein